jgi:hypothetical protein
MTGRRATTSTFSCFAIALALAAVRAAAVTFEVVGTTALAGQTADVSVRMGGSADASVVAAQADLHFDPAHTPIAATAEGQPDCVVNPSIRKEATRFAFHPPGCEPRRGDCVRVRAVLFSTDNVDPIPPGTELYRCRVTLATLTPPGIYPLTISNALYAPPSGEDFEPEVKPASVTVMTTAPAPPAASASHGGCKIESQHSLLAPWVLIVPFVWRAGRRVRQRT